ncbi:MAG: hypothetical protein PF482_14485 [Desulfobacteraceae bacterium]|jgi:hypothetical protein|nr:hypothetical protein [Desulfobacteraceae bacterium]
MNIKQRLERLEAIQHSGSLFQVIVVLIGGGYFVNGDVYDSLDDIPGARVRVYFPEKFSTPENWEIAMLQDDSMTCFGETISRLENESDVDLLNRAIMSGSTNEQ